MSSTPAFSDVIVYVASSSLAEAIRAVLKELGAKNVVSVDKADECTQFFQKQLAAPLILDFAVGAGSVHKALSAAQADIRSATRPIFLISSEPVAGIDGVAAEFGVSQVHVGELTKKVIKERLVELSQSRVFDAEIATAYADIAKFRDAGDWRELEMLVEKLRQNYPNEGRLVAELGEVYIQTNRFDECERLIKPLVQGDRKDPRLLNLLGRALLKMGRADDATVVLSQAKIINPFNVDRLIELGDAFLTIDLPSRAKANFKQALEHDEGNDEATRGVGKACLMLGEINEALPFLRELSGPEEAASVFNTAAILCMRNGRYDDGFNLYRIAVKAVGKNKAVLAKLCFNLGIGFHRMQDSERAKHCFAAAVQLDPAYEKAKTNLQHLEKSAGPAVKVSLEGNGVDSVLKIANLEKPRGPNASQYDELKGADYDTLF